MTSPTARVAIVDRPGDPEGPSAPPSGGARAADRPPTAPRGRWLAAGYAVLLVLGLVVRMHGAEQAELSYHPTRQLHSAVIAHAMHLDDTRPASDPARRSADLVDRHESRLETPINERIVATIWDVTGERLWVAALYESLIWTAGGLALLAILGRFVGWLGRIVGLSVYLFVPLSVYAGRSFQPDVAMVALTLLAMLLGLRHDERPDARRLVAVGLAAGAAVFVKPMAAPFVVLAFAALSVRRVGWWRTMRSGQSWGFAALAIGPFALASVTGLAFGEPINEYFLSALLSQASFYRSWLHLVASAVRPLSIIVAIAGLALARGRARALLVGLTIAYLATGVMFDYRVETHSYYHLELVPILAVCWAIAADWVPTWLERHRFGVAKLAVVPALAVVAVLAVIGAWQVGAPLGGTHALISADRAVARVTGPGAEVATISPVDGRDLAYYGHLRADELPSGGDRYLAQLQHAKLPSVAASVRAHHDRWIVVTDVRQWDTDMWLRAGLTRYRVQAYGANWIVYDTTRGPPEPPSKRKAGRIRPAH